MEGFLELMNSLNIMTFVTSIVGSFIILTAVSYLVGKIFTLTKSERWRHFIAIVLAIIWLTLTWFEILPGNVEGFIVAACLVVILYAVIGLNLLSLVKHAINKADDTEEE